MSENSSLKAFTDLVEIMARLRDPEKGCPWDLKQDFRSIAPYTLEEAYEVADAIEREQLDDLRGELGDLLLQVVFHAQMAEEGGLFDIADVCEAINDKMRRRHPHIFGDETLESAEAVSSRWDQIKAQERSDKAADDSLLQDIPTALPSLQRAHKLQKRAAGAGFDWPQIDGVWDKLSEEITELKQAEEQGEQDHIAEEMGDLLFSCVNLARHLKIDAETALRRANLKFEERFRAMEQRCVQSGREFETLDTEEMEVLWRQVKVVD